MKKRRRTGHFEEIGIILGKLLLSGLHLPNARFFLYQFEAKTLPDKTAVADWSEMFCNTSYQ